MRRRRTVSTSGSGPASASPEGRSPPALRPTIIKIDREIVHGIRNDAAKQALVEAFVSFGRRIGARLVAEGIETRRELQTLTDLGVEMGQGFLLGRPDPEPRAPRSLERLRKPTTIAPATLPGRRRLNRARTSPTLTA